MYVFVIGCLITYQSYRADPVDRARTPVGAAELHGVGTETEWEYKCKLSYN
jgi:hypothetical protein